MLLNYRLEGVINDQKIAKLSISSAIEVCSDCFLRHKTINFPFPRLSNLIVFQCLVNPQPKKSYNALNTLRTFLDIMSRLNHP